MEIALNYVPQPKQALLHESRATEILYGGAAGPGKSHALRMEALAWCTRIPGLQAYLFRRTFPELEKTHILRAQADFPARLGKYNAGHKRFEYFNGSMLHFCHCQYDADVFGYQGAEMHVLFMDELTSFSEFQYDYLRGRVRCALDVPTAWRRKIPFICCASNPGGVGHAFVKRRWIEHKKPLRCYRAPKREGGLLRQYIPGLLQDNAILMRTDPDYVHRLDALPEPYRSAYMNGDWDIYLGQLFTFNSTDHVIDPLPIPLSAPLMMTFDWGSGHPYSVGYWWTDADGRLYRFAEIYGCVPGMPNAGLRQTDDEIAETIVNFEKSYGLWGEKIRRLSDPTCFNKKPDFQRGGQGPSTAEVFARHGIVMEPGDPSRKLKIRQFHARLRVKRDPEGRRTEMPMLVVYNTCRDFIRTIPVLASAPNDPEDVDKRMEDHIYDEAALACMARPIRWAYEEAGPMHAAPGDPIMEAIRKR